MGERIALRGGTFSARGSFFDSAPTSPKSPSPMSMRSTEDDMKTIASLRTVVDLSKTQWSKVPVLASGPNGSFVSSGKCDTAELRLESKLEMFFVALQQTIEDVMELKSSSRQLEDLNVALGRKADVRQVEEIVFAALQPTLEDVMEQKRGIRQLEWKVADDAAGSFVEMKELKNAMKEKADVKQIEALQQTVEQRASTKLVGELTAAVSQKASVKQLQEFEAALEERVSVKELEEFIAQLKEFKAAVEERVSIKELEEFRASLGQKASVSQLEEIRAAVEQKASLKQVSEYVAAERAANLQQLVDVQAAVDSRATVKDFDAFRASLGHTASLKRMDDFEAANKQNVAIAHCKRHLEEIRAIVGQKASVEELNEVKNIINEFNGLKKAMNESVEADVDSRVLLHEVKAAVDQKASIEELHEVARNLIGHKVSATMALEQVRDAQSGFEMKMNTHEMQVKKEMKTIAQSSIHKLQEFQKRYKTPELRTREPKILEEEEAENTESPEGYQEFGCIMTPKALEMVRAA